MGSSFAEVAEMWGGNDCGIVKKEEGIPVRPEVTASVPKDLVKMEKSSMTGPQANRVTEQAPHPGEGTATAAVRCVTGKKGPCVWRWVGSPHLLSDHDTG